MLFKKNAGLNPERRTPSRMRSGIRLALVGLVFFAGCSTVPNPAKQLVNHLSTKASEAKMRDKVEKDKFPTAKEAGLD